MFDLNKNLPVILWTHYRSGSTVLMLLLKKYYDLNFYKNEMESFKHKLPPPYRMLGKYSFKVMYEDRANDVVNYILNNNIEYNHVLLFRESQYDSIISHEFAKRTNVWDIYDEAKGYSLDNLTGPINSDIDLVIENKNKKLTNLDYVYLKLLNAGKKVTLTTYESIEDVLQEFAKKPTVNKHYDLLHNIELEIKCENILNDFCFYKDYLKTTNNI